MYNLTLNRMTNLLKIYLKLQLWEKSGQNCQAMA